MAKEPLTYSKMANSVIFQCFFAHNFAILQYFAKRIFAGWSVITDASVDIYQDYNWKNVFFTCICDRVELKN